MPIRPEFRTLYPPNWQALSDEIRFIVAGGRCQRCDRPHGATLKVLRDGRWFDPDKRTWRNERGREARWPDIEEAIGWRTTKVVLATAHLDGNPSNNSRRRNLRALCQRCHLIHDRPRHLRQRWITCRRRYALGDLFLGLYGDLSRLLARGSIGAVAAIGCRTIAAPPESARPGARSDRPASGGSASDRCSSVQPELRLLFAK